VGGFARQSVHQAFRLEAGQHRVEILGAAPVDGELVQRGRRPVDEQFVRGVFRSGETDRLEAGRWLG
jgi:hypothetical protein